jgi:DNA adenine methylase
VVGGARGGALRTSGHQTARVHVRPLLKWAGGKRQLLPELRRFYPAVFGRYIEPFFGSGAVFFDLCASGRLEGRAAILIDANPDLIGCYEAVLDAAGKVGDALDTLAESHARDERASYYAVRDGRFNPLRDARRTSDGGIAYTPELAAMFIYLNRTGFNGLFRVNGRGAFNVPLGRYDRPKICSGDPSSGRWTSPRPEISFMSTRRMRRSARRRISRRTRRPGFPPPISSGFSGS